MGGRQTTTNFASRYGRDGLLTAEHVDPVTLAQNCIGESMLDDRLFAELLTFAVLQLRCTSAGGREITVGEDFLRTVG